MRLPLFSRIGEALERVRRDLWAVFRGPAVEAKTLDFDTLKDAYRQKKMIRAIVHLSTAFLFSNWFQVKSEDEEAAQFLSAFWRRNRDVLVRAGVEGSLFGNAYLAFGVKDRRVHVKTLYPGMVYKQVNPLDLEDVQSYEIVAEPRLNYQYWTVRQVITRDKITLFVNGRKEQEQSNVYGIIPIVHVAENRLSHEIYGTGDIDEALFDLIEKYDRILNAVVISEEYHGSPIPIFRGARNPKALKELLESEDWDPRNPLILPEGVEAEFLESKRPTGMGLDLLKLIFWNIIVQSETPEFILGVHMKAAQASTKEQYLPIEKKTERRRLVWTRALQQANEIVLRIAERALGHHFKTYETEIEWGEIFTKDEKTKVESILNLLGAGIISRKTAREKVPEYVDDPQEEAKRVQQEMAQESAYPWPDGSVFLEEEPGLWVNQGGKNNGRVPRLEEIS